MAMAIEVNCDDKVKIGIPGAKCAKHTRLMHSQQLLAKTRPPLKTPLETPPHSAYIDHLRHRAKKHQGTANAILTCGSG